MPRYESTRQGLSKASSTGVRKRSNVKMLTTFYNSVPAHDDDIYIVTVDGERLDTLSNDFYGTPTLWWFIGHVNKINTMNVPAGTSLRISFQTNLAKGR